MLTISSSLRASVAFLPLLIAACASAPATPPPAAVAAPAVAPQPAPGERLKALFANSDEADLKLSPLNALFRGDMRYADQFGDYISDGYLAAVRTKQEADLNGLLAIDRAALSPTDQIAYDVFKYQTQQALRYFTTGLTTVQAHLPVDHFNGVHVFFPDISSGQSAAPYKTVKDYENGLSRIDGFVTFLDRAIGRMREGMEAGHVQPKIVTRNVIGQLDTLLKMKAEDSPFFMPIKAMPADIGTEDKARLTAAYRQAIDGKIVPAYQRLKTFMETDYLNASRDVPGLLSMQDGPRLYAALVEQHTTTSLTPEQIHQIGLDEVARITRAMEAIKAEVGFKGTLKQFFGYLREDPKFKFKTKEALIARYADIQARTEAGIPRLFNKVPKTPFEVRPVPEFMEKNQAGAYYMQGTPDGSRPGVFYANTYDLPSRTSPGMETLFLHEAEPGHHFQISLAQENTALPPFMRFGGNTAYVEGWALYAESLGPELGLFTDPYQRFGHLDDEMLRAMRLVVDTGIHAKGWSRDQAIQYMLDTSAQSKTDATNEVERYIAMPGQALAYKIGQLTIRRLRTEAEAALGGKFDVRAFHDQVLDTGALPMNVLETKIRAWIAAEKAKA
ncbi:DUF885 domain-containing protein [Parapedomonas caeni]